MGPFAFFGGFRRPSPPGGRIAGIGSADSRKGLAAEAIERSVRFEPMIGIEFRIAEHTSNIDVAD
jgi:hypothetical protein